MKICNNKSFLFPKCCLDKIYLILEKYLVSHEKSSFFSLIRFSKTEMFDYPSDYKKQFFIWFLYPIEAEVSREIIYSFPSVLRVGKNAL